MKKLLLAVLVVLFAALVVVNIRAAASTPEKAVVHLLGAMQDGNHARAEAYTATALGVGGDNRRIKKLYNAMWEQMRYVVADTLIDEDRQTAQVIVSVTIVDMELLLAETSQQMLQESLGRRGWSERSYYKYLLQRVEGGECETMTTIATAHLRKTADGWRVDMENSKDFFLAITGDLGAIQ